MSAPPPELALEPSVPVEATPMIDAESAPASLEAEPVKPLPADAPVPPARPAFAALTDADAFRIEEDLLHRVLQRIDLSLEERLTEAVSAAVQQQLDAMLPRLRGEIETVLRSLVVEALARELSENTGSAPGSGAPALG